MLRRGAVALLAAASLGACGGVVAPERPAVTGTSPRELCEAVDEFRPAAFYCVGEPRRTAVGTLGPRIHPFARSLLDRCLGGRASPALVVETRPLDTARFSFDFDLMADERGRIPQGQLMPWSHGGASLHVAPGSIAHVRYRFDAARLERVRGLHEALREAAADPSGRDRALSCLDDLCYRSYKASLAWYVGRPRLTVALDSREPLRVTGFTPIGGSSYELVPDEELVVAAQAQPGPSVAGDLCRISAADKLRRSAELFATVVLRASPCLLAHALAGLLNTSCAGGRACAPAEIEGWKRRRLADVRSAMPAACQAIDRAFSRRAGVAGHTLRCGPDAASFAAAHPEVPLGEVFSQGPEALRFGLLRALLDGGDAEALGAALAFHGSGSGAWSEAQQSWEAARQYDGEIASLPSASWRDFRIAVFRRVLEVVSGYHELDFEAACEDEEVAWTAAGWAVIARDVTGEGPRLPLLRARTIGVARATTRFVESL